MAANNVIQLPTPKEAKVAEISGRTLSKYADAEFVTLAITDDNDQEELILPGKAIHLLLDILAEMSQGNAINILPVHAELTTKEAANVLNVSRPYLIGLLDKGELPFRMVGTHRRIMATDVFEYKTNIDRQRHQTLDELAALSQEVDTGYE